MSRPFFSFMPLCTEVRGIRILRSPFAGSWIKPRNTPPLSPLQTALPVWPRVSAYTSDRKREEGIGAGYYVVLSRILQMDFAEFLFHDVS